MLPRIVQSAFGVTLIALGAVGVWRGDFVPPWEPVAADAPVRAVLEMATPAISIVCGLGLLVPSVARLAARVLFGALALWFLAFRVRTVIGAPDTFGAWDGCAELGAVIAASIALAFDAAGARIARMMLGVSLACFGIGHFAYPDETAGLVPSYFPQPELIAFVTGIFFFIAAAFLLVDIASRRMAWLASAQIAGFTVFVWVPIVARGGAEAFAWSEFGLSILLTVSTAVVATFATSTA